MQAGNIPPNRFPSPNPNYAFVGPNYQKHGEVSSYDYNPYSDSYTPNKEAAQNMGLLERDPKPPSLTQQVAPLAIGLSAAELAKYTGQQAGPMIKDGIGGLLSSGAKTTATTLPEVAVQSTPAIQSGSISSAYTPYLNAQPAAEPGLMSGAGGLISASPLAAAGVVGGAALLAKGAKDLYKGNKTKGWEGWGGRAQLGITTGGLSELARAAGIFGQKSTRDYAKDITKGLLAESPDNANWQQYVSGMRDQYDSAPTDPSKPFAGKYSSFDEYQKAGLESSDLTGVAGNLQAYGPQWADLTQEQRQSVTQKNIDAGNYYSEKGDVLIKDTAKAQKALDEVLNPDKNKEEGA